MVRSGRSALTARKAAKRPMLKICSCVATLSKTMKASRTFHAERK